MVCDGYIVNNVIDNVDVAVFVINLASLNDSS